MIKIISEKLGRKKEKDDIKLLFCIMGAAIVYVVDLNRSGVPHWTYLNPFKIVTYIGWGLGESSYQFIKCLLKKHPDRLEDSIKIFVPLVKPFLILSILGVICIFLNIDFIFSIPQLTGTKP